MATVCDPPLMFNLDVDPGESSPLEASSPVYKHALQTITLAKAKHVATLKPVVDQNARGSNANFSLCKDPHSRLKPSLSMWPPCTSTPENWHPAEVCESPACLATNKKFSPCCRGKKTCRASTEVPESAKEEEPEEARDDPQYELYRPVVTRSFVLDPRTSSLQYNHDASIALFNSTWYALWNAGQAEGKPPQFNAMSTSVDLDLSLIHI